MDTVTPESALQQKPRAARFGSGIKDRFLLDPDCTYLNHGSYGAIALPVYEAADAVQRQIERQPSRFMMEDYPASVRDSAETLGRFLGARSEDLVFVENATQAVNAVLRSLVFMPGDEILTTGFAYNAVRKTIDFVAERAGARVVPVDVPFPIENPFDIVQAVEEGMSRRTRLIVVDHVTSETAVVMPVREIIRLARERNIPVLVDGAHAPGMLPITLEELDATWYAGNCHKWLGAPRGCGFLWTYRDFQSRIRPTTISHYVNDGYTAAFDWPGTKSFSPWLTVDAAIDFRAELGEADIYGYCRPLAARAAQMLATAWKTRTGTPRGMMSFMATVQLPYPGRATPEAALRLREVLRHQHNIEAFVKAIEGGLWVRLSAYVYNEMADFERLADIAPKVAAEI